MILSYHHIMLSNIEQKLEACAYCCANKEDFELPLDNVFGHTIETRSLASYEISK